MEPIVQISRREELKIEAGWGWMRKEIERRKQNMNKSGKGRNQPNGKGDGRASGADPSGSDDGASLPRADGK